MSLFPLLRFTLWLNYHIIPCIYNCDESKKRPCTLLRLPFPCVIPAVSSGKADLQHKRLLCYRCYLPVLTEFTESSLRRAQTINTTYRDTGQKKSSLGKEFDPTVADCGQQGTASSPSSTVNFFKDLIRITRKILSLS